MRHLIVLALLSAAAGCGSGPLDGIVATNASLNGWSEFSFTVIGGVRIIGTTLNITDDTGQGHSFGASLSGPGVGFVFDMSIIDPDNFGCGGASLNIPDGAIDANDLLGGYSGSNASAGMVLGGTTHDLENDSGVSLSADHLGIVIGAAAGVEILFLSVDN